MEEDEREGPKDSRASPALNKSGDTQSPPVYSSGYLFAGTHEIVIQHEAERYRLRITRNRKLILTK